MSNLLASPLANREDDRPRLVEILAEVDFWSGKPAGYCALAKAAFQARTRKISSSGWDRSAWDRLLLARAVRCDRSPQALLKTASESRQASFLFLESFRTDHTLSSL
jgi:hypothetical protein